MLTRYEKFEDIWTIDLRNLVRTQRLYVVRGGAPDNFRGVVCGCPLFSGKNVRESAVGTRKVSDVRSLVVVASRR